MPYSTINYSDIRNTGRLDAEYFQRKFLTLQKKLEKGKFKKLHELCEFIRVGPPGSALLASQYITSGIKVCRPSNLDGWSCDNAEITYISKDYREAQCLRLFKKEDVLISRVGDVKFGIIEDKNGCAISSNLIALRTKRELLDPYFLLAFLHTKFGTQQISRGKKAVSLASVGIGDISNMLIPTAPVETQSKISKSVRSGLKKIQLAQTAYSHAEIMLLEEIGFSKNEKIQSSIITNLTRIQASRRADAEYFLSQKPDSQTTIKSMQIGEIAKVYRGTEPGRESYHEAGKLFLRVSNITKFCLLKKSQKYINKNLYEKLREKYQPQLGEILLVKDGKPGVAFVINKPIEGIISEGIVRLKINSSLSSDYISLCINSPFCQSQILPENDGSLMPHWKIEQIKKLKIPITSPNNIKKLTNAVKKSIVLFQEGENLLVQAVRQVELLINIIT